MEASGPLSLQAQSSPRSIPPASGPLIHIPNSIQPSSPNGEGSAGPSLKDICEEEEGFRKEIELDFGSKEEEAGQTATLRQVEEKGRVQASAADVEVPEAEVEVHDSGVDEAIDEGQDTVPELKMPLRSTVAPGKTKRRPARLDLPEAKDPTTDLAVAFSALTHAMPIENIDLIQYPDGVERPKENLNVNAVPGKFRFVGHVFVHGRTLLTLTPTATIELSCYNSCPFAGTNPMLSRLWRKLALSPSPHCRAVPVAPTLPF